MKKEILRKGPLDMFFPTMLMREFCINDESDIEVGKTTVRYKAGKCRCLITEFTENDDYVLWDGSGTCLSIRLKTFEELKDEFVIVKFLNEDLYYKGREINNVIDLEANYNYKETGYHYNPIHKYIKHKHTGEIVMFTCRSLKETIWHEPGNVERVYNDYSYILKKHNLNLRAETELGNDEILKNWEVIEPEFVNYDYWKEA